NDSVNARSGVYLKGTGTVASNEVRGYRSSTYAAVYLVSGGPYTIRNNTIVKNIYGIRSGVDATLNNNIVAAEIGSYEASGTRGIYRTAGTVVSEYNDVYANDDNWYTGITSGEGDISIDALFVASGEANDFHLTASSPCIDAGTPEGTDIGAYPHEGPTITVSLITPNGGESWIEATDHDITWESSGSPDSINLYYSVNNGVSYAPIATGEADDGVYSWTIPNEPTSEALVRIEAVKGAVIATDESASTFTIEASLLSVTLRDAADTTDYTTWEVGTDKSLDTAYLMTTAECVYVKNDGNIAEDFSLSGEATNWTLSTTGETGVNICVLMGLFNADTAPTAADFSLSTDIITTEAVWATEAGGSGLFEGAETGVNVSSGTGRKLYIYLKTPIEITGGDEEKLTVTIGVKAN
ncbi:MAG: hypothetical protein JW782_00545, partial [Candidatus Saganbacteria bacterium]|nr:hypothetical protein [Candidatus Saganbacteria bacterium]